MRKFSKKNAFKLTNSIVIIIALVSFYLGGNLILRNEANSSYYLQKYDETCSGKVNIYYQLHCDWLLNQGEKEFMLGLKYIGIGAGTLILFYGGIILVNFLFPKAKD